MHVCRHDNNVSVTESMANPAVLEVGEHWYRYLQKQNLRTALCPQTFDPGCRLQRVRVRLQCS